MSEFLISKSFIYSGVSNILSKDEDEGGIVKGYVYEAFIYS